MISLPFTRPESRGTVILMISNRLAKKKLPRNLVENQFSSIESRSWNTIFQTRGRSKFYFSHNSISIKMKCLFDRDKSLEINRWKLRGIWRVNVFPTCEFRLIHRGIWRAKTKVCRGMIRAGKRLEAFVTVLCPFSTRKLILKWKRVRWDACCERNAIAFNRNVQRLLTSVGLLCAHRNYLTMRF